MSDITGGTAAHGTTSVSSEVIEKIAAAAAREVPGVADLGGDVSRFFNSILDKVGLDETGDAARGVSAKVKDGTVTIDVVVVLAAGNVVAEVTSAVQQKVTEAVQAYGLRVLSVHVNVDDIALTTAAPEAPAAPAAPSADPAPETPPAA
ncbi:Asp23/Gls24 family envelope stress response protein [Actinoplanes sp. NPDC051851]|uniref:Asp23/Gls24 family envelope stress response protein n=1 Tax=Actinoplanes sp. NPDC051851 TaxID=3154753 RepID=UPI003435003B